MFRQLSCARSVSAIAMSVLFAACSGGHAASPQLPTLPQSSFPMHASIVQLQSTRATMTSSGSFVEYNLPSNAFPSYVASAASDTVWFTECNEAGTPAYIYRLSANGAIARYAPPLPYREAPGECSITSIGTTIWYLTWYASQGYRWMHVLLSTATGAPLFRPATQASFGGPPLAQVYNLALAIDGRLWFGIPSMYGCYSQRVCTMSHSSVGSMTMEGAVGPPGFQLPGSCRMYGTDQVCRYSQVTSVAAEGNYVYLSAFFLGAFPQERVTAAAVLKVSMTGATVGSFTLPVGSIAQIITGPDGNLWVAEPGVNQIASISPGGSIKQYTVPTSNAGVANLTAVPGTIDARSALWFTESLANKIGRISTGGAFEEYTVPTVESRPTGIAPCTTACGAHGGVWFAEGATNKIARFNFP